MCHRPNNIAPMSLLTHEEVLPFAGLIRQSVDQRKMPPWHADPSVGEFMNDARLSDADIAAIDEWVKGGMKKGDQKDMPPAPVFEPGWHMKPDVIFTIPEFLVPKTALDDYEYIYVPTNFTEEKWIQSGEVLPGDRRAVHHATVSVVDRAELDKHMAEHSREDAGVDQYHYRTGKVLHLRPDAPVIDDGCSTPDGGGIPGKPSGYLNIVPAIYLPHYDFRWQETYFLKHQFLLPKGTKLMTVAYFDNSKNNPQNPDPSKALRWGEPSDEEMMGFWLQFADPQLVTDKPALAQK